MKKLNEAINIIWHLDEDGNKISMPMNNEPHTVINNKITLIEIPDEFYGVTIKDGEKILTEIESTNTEKQLTENQFRVHYGLGVIFLNPIKNDRKLTIDYYSRGLVMYPASRIFTKSNEADGTINNLQDILDDVTDTLKDISHIEGIVEESQRLEEVLDNQNKAGISTNGELNSTINNANETMSHLVEEINLTENKKQELEGYVTKLKNENINPYTETKKNELDSYSVIKQNEIANYISTDLDTHTNIKKEEITNHTEQKINELNTVTSNTNEVIKDGDRCISDLEKTISTSTQKDNSLKTTIVEAEENHTLLQDDVNVAESKIAEIDELKDNISVYEDYIEEKTYYPLNKVVYNDDTYVVLKEIKGITPIDDGVNYKLIVISAHNEASRIKTDAIHRFVSDDEKHIWNDTQVKVEELEKELNESKTIPFNPTNSNASVISYPDNTKGLVRVGAKGGAPIHNFFTPDFVGAINKNGTSFRIDYDTDRIVSQVVSLQVGEYTIFANVKDSNVNTSSGLSLYVVHIDNTTTYYAIGGVGTHVLNVNFEKEVKSVGLYIYSSPDNEGTFTDVGSIAIYSGDLTNKDDLHYIEGTATCAQSYDFVSRGKNLFDGNIEQGNWAIDTGVKQNNDDRIRSSHITDIKPNTDYTFVRTKGDGIWALRRWIDGDFHFTPSNNATTDDRLYFNSGDKVNGIVFIDESNDLTCQYSLLEGTITNAVYEPYRSEITNITLPRPMVKLSDTVYDEVDSDGDLTYNVDKVVLDGSESYTFQSINTHGITNFYFDFPVNMLTNSDLFSPLFPQQTSLIADTTTRGLLRSTDKIYLRIESSTASTVTELKQWLSNNNTIIHYQFVQPEIIHDGEQGYQAPFPLPAYQNGDLVQIGVHRQKYIVSNSNTITLTEKVSDLESGDYGIFKLNKDTLHLEKLQGITLGSDGITITLDAVYNEPLDVYGALDPNTYLNIIPSGLIPGNVNEQVTANMLGITSTNKKIMTLEDTMRMMIVQSL